MKRRTSICAFILLTAVAVLLPTNVRSEETPKPPKIGDTIKEYKFRSNDDREVSLAALAKKGPMVLVVLRGFPGYQCPVCTAQVAELRKHAKEFKELGSNVVLVYPGAVDNLQTRANQFLKDEKLPEPLVLVLDPKYEFIRPLGLRWDQKGETAYPSTFVLDKNRVVKYAKVSKTHGDRAKPKAILDAVRAINVAGATGQEIPQTR
jgi:thioredoxin-dependent peroxiredoxin